MYVILKRFRFIYNIFITFIIFLLSLYLFHIAIINIRNVYRSDQLEHGAVEADYFKIFDLYGAPNHASYSTFIENENSIIALKSLYDKLIGIKNCNFIEFNDTMVQFKGQYKNDNKFVHHYEDITDQDELQEFINQEITRDGKKALYTNIKTILIGESALNSYKLDERITAGRIFSNNDFFINKSPINLNVILGFQYNDIYNIGDEFTVLYLGEELNFKIIGFLQENTNIQLDKEIINLDYHVIMPSFNMDLNEFNENKLRKFSALHYSKKTWGYLSRTEETDFIKVSNDFKNEVKNLNLDYALEPLNLSTDQNYNILYALFEKRNIVITLIVQVIKFCIIMLLIFYYGNYKNLRKHLPAPVNKIYFKQLKYGIHIKMLVQFLIGHIFAIVLYKVISINFISKYMFLDALKVVVGIGLIVIVATFIITNIMMNEFFNNTQ